MVTEALSSCSDALSNFNKSVISFKVLKEHQLNNASVATMQIVQDVSFRHVTAGRNLHRNLLCPYYATSEIFYQLGLDSYNYSI